MPTPPLPPPIIVHALDHALAAAAAATALGVPVVLRSAGTAAGVGWFVALKDLVTERHPGATIHWIFDCAGEAGTAQGAIRRGIRRIRFSGSPQAAERLAALVLLDTDDRPPLDLADRADPERSCRDFLAASHPVAMTGPLGYETKRF